jgi:mRNA interferase RelE/StbE
LKVEFKKSFVKDLKRLEHAPVKNQIKEVIEIAEQAQSLRDITNIKKLRGGDRYYRIRLGDYRIGLILEDDTLIFVRFLHRKDLYRYFP